MFGVKETVRNDFHLAFIYSFVQTREVFSFSLLIGASIFWLFMLVLNFQIYYCFEKKSELLCGKKH